MRVLVYVTAPDGTVHLASEYNPHDRTMCGMGISVLWRIGDETVSHYRATCDNCRRLAHRAPERVSPSDRLSHEGGQ